MSGATARVLAMYDIRGIQKFIYRTPNIKDAMGASVMIEDIITDALKHACEKLKITDVSFEWEDKPYAPAELSVYVLYIGGGNAYVLFRNREIYISVNKEMSRYIQEYTYSLQLTSAYVEQTEDYSLDFKKLTDNMAAAKEELPKSSFLGALPIVRTEYATGYPAVENIQNRGYIGSETKGKLNEKNRKIKEILEDKILDKYTNGDADSRLAVVHIDGNNMGMRIRSIIKDEKDYVGAVGWMRKISSNIKRSYQEVFEAIQEEYNKKGREAGIDAERFVRKIIVAGDDVTYVCNAHIALQTVRDFAEKISKKTMNGKTDSASIGDFGFSICAGIAYFNSHFPFSIAYDVAEDCCDSAKDKAKNKGNMDGCRIGNYLDFQICSNVQCRNLKRIRKEEYRTASGESLLLRPYYIPVENEGGLAKNAQKEDCLDRLTDNILYFSNKIPRSFTKEIRNTYSLGERRMKGLEAFLESRNHEMPDGSYEMYLDISGVRTAKWYDALEIIDYSSGLIAEGKRNDD